MVDWYVSIDEQIGKKWYTHPIEYYSAIKNKFVSFEGKLVKLAIIILNEITVFLKDNYWMYSPIWKQYANKIRCKSRRETIWDMKGNQQEGGRKARDNWRSNIPKYIICIYENIIGKTIFCIINMNHFLKKSKKHFSSMVGRFFFVHLFLSLWSPCISKILNNKSYWFYSKVPILSLSVFRNILATHL